MNKVSSPNKRELLAASRDSTEWQQWRLQGGGYLNVSSLGDQLSLTYNGHGLTPAESDFVCRLIDKAKGLGL